MANEPDQAPPSVVERKLVTIMSADVAEYSRLMAEDEEHTLRLFREHSQTFAALIALHHGRIFNTAGDAIMAEFTSPVEAVRCATDIQAALRTRNEQLPPNRQVRFRIGVNLGDVMTQNSDLLGDGVNVASRLQSAAEPGGICISGSVYDQIRNKLSLSFESLGERHYKNIPVPVRTFTIAGTEDGIELPAPKRSPMRLGAPAAIAAAALLVLAGGYFGYSTLHGSRSSQSLGDTHAAASAKAGVKQARAAAKPASHLLDTQASALLADAQRLQRPDREIEALTDSNTKIAALAAQLHGLKPGDKATADPLIAQMNDLATDMSHSEATALERAAKLMWRDMEQPPGKNMAADAASAIAAVNQAKANLDDAVAAAGQAQDGAASLAAARQALSAYSAFATAYDAAAPFYVSARRSEIATLAAAAQVISDKVIAQSRVNKPWLLASHTRKAAYQTLADDATAAQSEAAEMDALAHRASAASGLRKVSAALAQAATIKARLNELLTSSNAAYATYSQ